MHAYRCGLLVCRLCLNFVGVVSDRNAAGEMDARWEDGRFL